jgi:hypothetical protein
MENNLKYSKVADVVFLIERGLILRTQVIRVTPHQIVIENGDKFWKKTGFRVGDNSKSKAVIVASDNKDVKNVYNQHLDLNTFIEFLNQLQISATFKTIELAKLKPLLEQLSELLESFNNIEV